MSIKDITSGDKIAKAIGGRFIKSKKGTVGLEVAFRFEEKSTNTQETLTWVGWLSRDALKNTMETLVRVLGYNGCEDTDHDGALTDKNAFKDVEIKLVVDLEESQTAEGVPTGKFYPRIKYVNSIGGSGYAGVNVQVVKSELANIGFRGAFLTAQNSSGVKPEVKKFADSDVPF